MWWASKEFLKLHEAFEHLNMGRAYEWLFGPGSRGEFSQANLPRFKCPRGAEGMLIGALIGIYLQPA